MNRRITIDPITRLEGHGRIEILLDDDGDVASTHFQVPELRGFERFCLGRAAEEMPQITSTICGVCPAAHHMASARTLDAVYGVEPTPAAHNVRELFYNLFIFEDHLLHFYFLGAPDFLVGSEAPAADRNVLGLVQKTGVEIGRRVLKIRREAREIMSAMSGRVIHPVFALPGGVSKPLEPDLAARIIKSAPDLVEFAQFSLDLFRDAVLKDVMHATTLSLDHYALKTHYMGLVDKNNRVAFYRGDVRVVGTDGAELVRFRPADYLEHLGEHVEPWSYVKFPFLKKLGWTGFTEGPLSGLYRVGPLGRVNSADGMRTPKAQEQYEMMQAVLGDKPYHQTLAFHWARLIEALQAAETVEALIHDPTTKDQDVRTLPTSTPTEGVGIVEAPRGTLIHHYKTDPEGILTFVNLLVATVHNAGPIQMSVAKAAKGLIHGFNVNQGILNGVEMAFRAYDPCLACATHSLPGEMPLEIVICDSHGGVVERLSRSARGTVEKYPT